MVAPYELERPHHPPDSYVTVSETYLKFRVRFPLHPFFIEVFEYFGLTVFQITPNGWAQMIGLFGLFAEHGIGPPTTVEFAWFYSSKVTRMTRASTISPRGHRRGCRPLQRSKRALVPGNSHTFSLRRSRSKAPLVWC